MDQFLIVYAVLGILFLWMMVLSFNVFSERSFLKKVFPIDKSQIGDKEGVVFLRNQFQEILKALGDADKREEIVNRNIRELARRNMKNIQKVKVLKYNPYADIGGNVSFSLVLLDGRGTGVLITSLHTRSGTRVYSKYIQEGKSEVQLSAEEKEVLEQALERD